MIKFLYKDHQAALHSRKTFPDHCERYVMSSNGERPGKAVTVKPVVDWRLGAELLARGETITDTARQIGCSRQQLSRRFNHDQLFKDLVAEFEPKTPERVETRLGSLRQRLHDAIDAEVQNGNVRVILWLADRMKLINPPEHDMQKYPLDDLLKGMSEEDLKEFENLK